jgi:glutamyl-tRNA reductase
MQIFTLGLNHHSAPLAIRERIAFTGEGLKGALREIARARPAQEAAILSTCNRTELYCAAGDPGEALAWLAGRFSTRCPGRQRCVTPSGWLPASIRWCSASRRSSGR